MYAHGDGSWPKDHLVSTKTNLFKECYLTPTIPRIGNLTNTPVRGTVGNLSYDHDTKGKEPFDYRMRKMS